MKEGLSVLLTVKNRSRMVLPNGTTLWLLPNCLRSLVSALPPDYPVEVIISDWGSEDWPLERWVPDLMGDIPYRIVRAEGEFHRSTGRNIAAAEAQYDNLFFLDADMYLRREVIAQGLSKLAVGEAFFPQCLYLISEDHSSAFWCDGKGVCFVTREMFEKAGKWPQPPHYNAHHDEDHAFYRAVKDAGFRVSDPHTKDLFHQYHPGRSVELMKKPRRRRTIIRTYPEKLNLRLDGWHGFGVKGQVLEAEVDTSKEVDVIIISFARTEELYRTTLHSLETLFASESAVKFNAIVIESNPDITYDVPGTVTVHPRVSFGYHRYLNMGRKMGKAPYVCLCNNDLDFEKGWATEIIAAMEEDPDMLSASPFSRNPHINEYKVGENTGVHYGYQVRKHIAGWCIFQQRSIYDIIGDLDEQFTFWYADNDYGCTIESRKVKHGLVTSSVVNHLHSQTLSTVNKTQNRQLTHGQKMKFIRKWPKAI